MKKFLKFAAVFILGLAIGGTIASYFTGKYFINYMKQYVADHTLTDISQDIMLLQMVRENDTERFFKVIEDGIPEYVLMITQNSEIKESGYSDTVLKKAKTFYKCTNTPVPKEIEGILEKVELKNGFGCKSKEKNNEKGKEE